MTIRATSLTSFVGVLAFLFSFDASADDAPTCSLGGTTSPASNAEVFLAATGGAAHAKFTGASVPLRLGAFPATFATGRVRVETGDGQKPYVHVTGYAAPSAFRYFASESVALVPGHVWLTKGMELRPTGAKGDELEFEHEVLGTRTADGGSLKLRGSVSCSHVALAPLPVEGAEAPKGARYFHMKKDAISLYDAARGKVVLELRMAPDGGKVFWSTEVRADWVHVMAPGDITLDGWVRANELEPLIHGEVFDMSALEPMPFASPTLALAEPPKTLTATTELPLSAKADGTAASLGSVPVGATFFAMEVSTSWTSVVPTDLSIMPVDGAGFWVKTATLPKP